MEKRSHPPGQHGATQTYKRRESDYAKQLLQKQRLQAQYSLTERKLHNYVERATRSQGVTGEVLIQILETRLDAFVLRAGFAPTIYAARQAVTHGHFEVDGRRLNRPGYELRPGQTVALRAKSRALPLFVEALEKARPPSYISLAAAEARLTRAPARDEVPVICDEQIVIEYYSR
jgi:small subunit ribosomal protein S4